MDDHDPLLQRIRSELDSQAESLDGATRSRLTQARHAALDASGRRPARWLTRRIPAMALVLVAALALVNLQTFWRTSTSSGPVPIETGVAATDDLEMLAAEDLELLADLEFYLWLETALPETDAG